MMIGITGLNASGKDTVAQYICQRGFIHVSLSDFIRDECTKKNLEHTRENLIEVGREIREKFGYAELARRALEKIGDHNAVVSSIRHPDELALLKQHNNFHLIAVTVNDRRRFERDQKRNDAHVACTFEEFQKLQRREMSGTGGGQQMKEILDQVDDTIQNDTTLSDLHAHIDTLLNIYSKEDHGQA